MMTLTQSSRAFDNEFDVALDGEWVGRVWSTGREWMAQDFDGDVDGGFAHFLEAAEHVRSLSGGMVPVAHPGPRVFCEAAAEWDHDWNDKDVCNECDFGA